MCVVKERVFLVIKWKDYEEPIFRFSGEVYALLRDPGLGDVSSDWIDSQLDHLK